MTYERAIATVRRILGGRVIADTIHESNQGEINYEPTEQTVDAGRD